MGEERELKQAMARLAASSPCKECASRTTRCHVACIPYLRYDNARRWLRAQTVAASREAYALNFGMRQAVEKSQKRRRRHGKSGM